MDPFTLHDDSLILDTGELAVDEAVEAKDHLPNGYFWTGVAEYLVAQHRPDLSDKIEYDPEAGAFAAYGDRESLLRLKDLMLPAVTDPLTITTLIGTATAAGFEFDD